ncbi:hypothetical protein INS49_012161 [Diaporthe citri]|uniref:uncharacterized protein n=1 Tax=Diaporthe citri TaxID=83186 RepID=UPI001C824C11|nr:uncharacterized protein INS49_012161 [Diaporthe citri]KAG6358643.1 hypothetical protein INS49_012161 [Diaporthe citri]
MGDPSRWATVAPPDHIDTCCVCEVLDPNHQNVFATAMSNLLSTEIAERTFAQIIDGLPLKDVAFSMRTHEYTRYDPVFSHVELCPGVLERTRMLRDAFDPKAMELRTDVLQRYQEVPAGSRASKLPLLELVAVAVHTIAAELFGLDGAFHKRDTPCTSHRGDEGDDISRIPPWPTTFAVVGFTDTNRFPAGIADVAGYWAEDIIFGGVVLFGRGESGTGHEGVWFNSHRRDVTYRIYALTSDQLDSLLQFLEWVPNALTGGQEQQPECPLPILGDDNNLTRIQPDVAIPMHNVFRDRWERKAVWRDYSHYCMGSRRCVKTALDFPEVKNTLPGAGRRRPEHQGKPLTFGDFLKKRQDGKGSGPQPGT